jgi:hypothetical protein
MRRIRTVILPAALLVVLGVGAAVLPSYAHDDGDKPTDGATHRESIESEVGADEPHSHGAAEEPPSHDEPEGGLPYFDRIDDQGNIIPEKPHLTGTETVENFADLQALEKEVDPDGSPYTYVCANPGDRLVKVIHEYPPLPEDAADLKPKAEIGKIIPGGSGCEGYSMVAGK